MDKIEIIGMEMAVRCKMFQWHDHGHAIAYLPSLDLSGYGPTFAEAVAMLELAVSEYCEWAVYLPQKELDAELHRLGWELGEPGTSAGYSKAFVDRKGALQGFDLGPEELAKVSELQFEHTY